MDIVERLREYQESWADSIKRMDCGEFGDNGIMSQIRAEQHDTWKKAADEIETLRRERDDLLGALERMVKTYETALVNDDSAMTHANAAIAKVKP